MIQNIIWILAIILLAFVAYLLSYIRFRKMIVDQTKRLIQIMKAEESELEQQADPYKNTDVDFVDLERAALGLRKKYLRLRKQSQEERKGYETVFSGLKEAIVTVDQNLKILSFNSAFISSFRWVPNKEQPYHYLQDVIRDPQVISTFKKAFELNDFQKNESENSHLFVTPLPSRYENEMWCLGVFYDLTEIRKTEKMRIDFVANASHELRTPLTVIKGYSEVLDQRLSKLGLKDEKELLQPILSSVKNMSELMDDLLNLSKLDLGQKLQKANLSTEKLTEAILSEVETLQELSKKTIHIDNQAKQIMGNEDALKQIIRNLLVNAIKYSGEAESIMLSWGQKPGFTILKVKDFGPGISKENQDRIFERFYRIDKGRGRDHGGSGLGLALVKHHVLSHGGRISLVSEAGHGSEFVCEFPND